MWLSIYEFIFLEHSNVVAFVSHCGMGSILEAVYYQVPVIGIGIFGDQVLMLTLSKLKELHLTSVFSCRLTTQLGLQKGLWEYRS